MAISTIFRRMLRPRHPGSSRGVSGDGPEGGAGSGSPPPWFVTTAHAGRPDTFGCTGSRNAAVERREANALAEGRETPQKRLGVRNARHNGASQAPSAVSALRSPSVLQQGDYFKLIN